MATDDETDVVNSEKIFEVDIEFFRPVTSDNWRKEELFFAAPLSCFLEASYV